MRIATLGYGADGGSLRHLASEPKARFYSVTNNPGPNPSPSPHPNPNPNPNPNQAPSPASCP